MEARLALSGLGRAGTPAGLYPLVATSSVPVDFAARQICLSVTSLVHL